ncbi:histidine kinase dimerization/phosphoacceptor domain -containing protein [Maribacter sp.]|uniref:histidine kinase dimerization/phosphoacceptor domain -containing protein n=1 Tax=Maribacter sp. TaxID=1897614 RepID=UPI0025BCC39F|nr:histidine kinase dimerization/phosphoacceptor domain -containing protein [Maribacter sp.]
MKNLLKQFVLAVFVFFFTATISLAQDSIPEKDNVFKKFKSLENTEGRFKFFFNTPNRYIQNSAYDWLDSVNLYLNESEHSGDTLAINKYAILQSQIHYDLGDYDKSLAIAKELYEKKKNLEEKSNFLILNLLDKNYSKLELYAKQIEIRKEKKELGITENVAFYDIYSNLGLHRKAMDDYFKEEKKFIAEDDFYGQAVFYNNVGSYLRLDKSTPTALSTYKKAKGFVNVYLNDVTKVKTAKQLTKANHLKGIIEGNIGKCHVLLKQYEDALPYLERSVQTIQEFNKGKFSSDEVENTLEMAECYLQMGDLEKTTDILSNTITPSTIENILKKNKLFASYYSKTEDYKSSAYYLSKVIRMKDSVSINQSSLKKQQLAAVVGQDLEYSKKMMEQQKQALEDSRNEMIAKDERINIVFISLVFLLLGFAGLVYAYLRIIKSQRLIVEQKHIIEKALVEKDSHLKEIHHRVKNNLQMVSSLLSLQTKNTRSKAAIAALEEGKSRVKAMALIHQKLYQNEDLSVIEMQGYIESLINSVQSVYKKGGHSISITIDAEGVELDIDRAIPFGLMLNELVSNSFKYAFPDDGTDGKIYIHLRKNHGQEGFFEYTDNGIGLPEDTEVRAEASMGIRLMNRLANQLQTSLNTDRTTEGVRFWFNFK